MKYGSRGAERAKKMASTAENQLEVWGSPIDHSLSPTLHRAAYGVLKLPWTYERREVSEKNLSQVWNERSDLLRGLSLTMPLKAKILERVEKRLDLVEHARVANTVFRSGGDFVLANTDVFGLQKTLDFHKVEASEAWIFGAGATARAAGLAMARSGVEKVTLFARNPTKSVETFEIMTSVGLEVNMRLFSDFVAVETPDLVVSTLPSGSGANWDIPQRVRASAVFFDVNYDPWPSPLASHWAECDQLVISGLRMLAFQAIAQIRLFVNEDVETPLPEEGAVLSAMFDSVHL